jgi:hypothetical protein
MSWDAAHEHKTAINAIAWSSKESRVSFSVTCWSISSDFDSEGFFDILRINYPHPAITCPAAALPLPRQVKMNRTAIPSIQRDCLDIAIEDFIYCIFTDFVNVNSITSSA